MTGLYYQLSPTQINTVPLPARFATHSADLTKHDAILRFDSLEFDRRELLDNACASAVSAYVLLPETFHQRSRQKCVWPDSLSELDTV